MQGKTDLANQPIFSLEELFEVTLDRHQVASTAISAMKILMLRNQQAYLDELNELANMCAQLLKQGATVDSLVETIKSSMTTSYQDTLNKVTSEIGLGQFQLNHTNPQTIAGQNLEKRIKSMRRFKETPLTDIIEAVITDTLVQASAKFGADLGDFDFLKLSIAMC